jgi:hypothetical protein
MTSVPKPLKFLRPFYEELGKIRRVWHASMVEERVSLIPDVHQVEGGGRSRFDGSGGTAGTFPLPLSWVPLSTFLPI